MIISKILMLDDTTELHSQFRICIQAGRMATNKMMIMMMMLTVMVMMMMMMMIMMMMMMIMMMMAMMMMMMMMGMGMGMMGQITIVIDTLIPIANLLFP